MFLFFHHTAGISSCVVNLDDDNAVVFYNPIVITTEEIRLAIEDMGFDATLTGLYDKY